MLKVQKDLQNDVTFSNLKLDQKLIIRLRLLKVHFRICFGQNPSFYVRVPGRVNLIGEHVDYCGYSVCPMAINQDILVAICKSHGNDLRLVNMSDEYPNYQHENFREIRDLKLDEYRNGPSWHKYFLCGIKGALEVIPKDQIPNGLFAAVSGNIPPNAGLSSSSALVSAALFATVHASQHIMSKEDMATISANAERYIGTQGGGMDQAIAFLGKAGSAKFIEFNPLRAFDVTLPNNAVFVIAHSLIEHNKASASLFNTRVLECRFAAQIIAKKHNIDWRNIQKLIDVQVCLDKSLEEMSAIVLKDLQEESYILEEISQILGTTVEQLKDTSKVLQNITQKFKLRQRAYHVFQEAARVMAFRDICKREDIDGFTKLCQLGSLMSKSQLSLQNLYECSHPKIDALINTAVECGALGAKLTGAGWGGCIIAIITKEKVKEFIQNLEKKFYENDAESNVFQTEPAEGATMYEFE